MKFNTSVAIAWIIVQKTLATQRTAQRVEELAQTRAEQDKLKAEADGAAEIRKKAAAAEAEAVKYAAEAEAAAITLKAEAQADATKKLAAALTEQLVQYELYKNWNGQLPTTMTPNSAIPFLGNLTPNN